MSDPKFSNNHLSIELGGGFSFLVKADRSSRAILETEVIPLPESGSEQGNFLLERSALAKQQNRSVSLSRCHGKFVLVPDLLFDATEARSLLALNAELQDYEETLIMDVPAFQAKLIYAADTRQTKGLIRQHPMLLESHCAGHFLSLCKRMTGGNKVMLQFYPGFFLLAAFRDDRLQMINAFPCKDQQDVVYYALYACEQIHFDNSTTAFVVMGEIDADMEIAKSLEKYTSGLHYAEPIGGFQSSASSPHRFLTLTEQFRCAL